MFYAFVSKYSDTAHLKSTKALVRHLRKQYLPKGYGFPTDSSSSINRKYVYSAKKQLPEMVNSSDMVNLLSSDEQIFTLQSTAINHFFAIEKSM